uniref:Uncharacterized protein n=1 Tax=Arundo donax TaxID=35708 RepID=A0A0A9AGT7_ARUDO
MAAAVSSRCAAGARGGD